MQSIRRLHFSLFSLGVCCLSWMLFLAALINMAAPGATVAEEEQVDRASHLFGDWGGSRALLEDAGLSVESTLYNDLIANVSGGINRSAVVLGNYDLILSFNPEKSGLWSGGTLLTYLVGTYGDAPSKSVGDYQYTDNLEVYSTVTLYQFYYEQSLLDQKVQLLIGLHDYNVDFYALEYGLGLLNSSFGIGAEVSQVLPPIFNATSVGARLKVQPTNQTYLMAALYDGIPGDPNNPRGTHIRFDGGDGVFWGSELGVQRPAADYSSSRYFKAAVGFWQHTKQFTDFNQESRNRNYGWYILTEAMVAPEKDSVEQGLGAFAAFGTTDSSVNQVSRSILTGLRYQGIINGRDDDILSVGYARAENGNEYMGAFPDVHRAETALELSYIAQVLPFLKIQPDLQYVINPSMSRSVNDALVLGVRVTIDL